MSPFWQATIVILWIVTGATTFLLLGTMRQLGLLLQRIGDQPGALITTDGLERGTKAPDFLGSTTGGAEIWLSDLKPVRRLVVFLSTSCSACVNLIPHLREVASTRPEIDIVVVCRGDHEGCAEFAGSFGVPGLPVVDVSGVVQNSYEVRYTPFAYLLDEQGIVLMRGVANDWTQLESLLRETGTPQSAPFISVAESELKQRSLDGR